MSDKHTMSRLPWTRLLPMTLYSAAILAMPYAQAQPATSVNNLENVVALLNIIANLIEVVGLIVGGPGIIIGIVLLFLPDRRQLGKKFLLLGLIMVIGGLALPVIINWLVACARNTGLFS